MGHRSKTPVVILVNQYDALLDGWTVQNLSEVDVDRRGFAGEKAIVKDRAAGENLRQRIL